jgi:predicted AAA+ superfamily ATPase
VFNFGKNHYQDIIVFNFENNDPLKTIFEQDAEPERIISELEKYSLKRITSDVLIFFDEIQACPKALTSLKFFTEQAPQFNIIAAGSLLGVAVNHEGFSFPVGKISRLNMYPMNFEEFLLALGENILVDVVKNAYENDTPLPQNIHEKALRLYNMYLVTGGMPKAVLEYIEKKDFEFVRIIQRNILADYEADMVKYASVSESVKIRAVFASIPAQLAKENRKFQYSTIGSNARAASYELGIQWLADAGLIYKCNKTHEGKIPLKSYVDLLSYKIYMNDVGLLNCYSNTPPVLVLSGNFGGEAKGAVTENYIMQQLVFNELTPYYWESQGKAEVDFILQFDSGIVIPIEAKSSIHTKSKSLSVFVKKYGINKSIRITAKNFGFENNIKSVPLYAAFCITQRDCNIDSHL